MKIAILIIISFLGAVFPETLLMSRRNQSPGDYQGSVYTQYGSIRTPKSVLEIRQGKAMMIRANKDRRTSSALMGNQEFLEKKFDLPDHENDINEDSLPKSAHKLSSKAVGYSCPMGANSIGDGLAIIKADPYDCNGYYYCMWGIYKPFKCTWPLLWNDEIKACDWHYNVNCGYRN